MLKYITGFILCLVVLIELAYVPPTYAASAHVIITHVHAGGAGAALEEMVILYNNSADEIDISDWCFKNKSNVSFACFSHDPAEAVYLPGYSFATIASYPLATTINFDAFSILYTPSNQSSGNIVGGGDTISLVDEMGTIVDSHTWTTSLLGGMLFSRILISETPLTYSNTDQASDWQIRSPSFIPDSQVELRAADPDVCPNVGGRQTIVPEGLEIDMNGDCRKELAPLVITEILPNATGSDTGQEFIELYNPNEYTVDLSNYTLLVGPNLEKTFSFPAASSIPPHSYVSFNNTQISFSLLNTSSRVQLRHYNEIVFDAPSYDNPDEAAAWALIDGTWQYTTQPTPGSENLAEVLTGDKIELSGAASTLKPCKKTQYRSPETHRCRNLVTSSSTTRSPCKENQYRSPETNRCRNIGSAATGPSPCKEGQERNPETNRCRTIKAMPIADYGVLGETTSAGTNWYIWFAVGGVILLALVYAIWEWHYELGKFFGRLRGFVRIRK